MNNIKLCLLTIVTLSILTVTAACNSITPSPTSVPTVIPTEIPKIAIQPVDIEHTLTVQSMERTYFLHVPSGLNNQQSVPLVFVFHGLQESSTYARIYSGMDNIANLNNFVVVYPNGSGGDSDQSWNAGNCCGYAQQNNVDDPAFIRAIIGDVGTMVKVDTKRIYASGFSNGALLSYRLACEMSDTFAAVAPVAGVLVDSPCLPQQPVSLIHVHGMTDTVVPIGGGGLNPNTSQPFPSVADSISTWVKLDGCKGTEKKEQNGIVTHSTYGECAAGVGVELYAVGSNGHNWPSQYVIPISQIIWEFFAAHPKL